MNNKKPDFIIFHSIGWIFIWLTTVYFSINNFGFNTKEIGILTIHQFLGSLISLSLYYLYVRIEITKMPFPKVISLVTLISIMAASIWFLFIQLLNTYLRNLPIQLTLPGYVGFIFLNGILFITYSSLYLAVNFRFNWIQQKEQTEKAYLMAQSSQFQMLRYQLNPHFIFNAHSSLRALVRKGELKKAEIMITELSELLRHTLTVEEEEIPLKDEVYFIKHYLDIEKVRYGERLIIEISIDPSAEEYPIPNFLLNPLVDNAVKYGMETSDAELRIQIRAVVLQDKSLNIQISNSGSWYERDDKDYIPGTGKGIENVKRRLEFVFKDQYSFSIEKSKAKVSVNISLNKF